MLDADWVMRELAHGPERRNDPAVGHAIQMVNCGACPAGPSLLALIRVLCQQKADALAQAVKWAERTVPTAIGIPAELVEAAERREMERQINEMPIPDKFVPLADVPVEAKARD